MTQASLPTESVRYGKVLEQAIEIINGERLGTYGPPAKKFKQIAQMWSTYLGIEVKSEDVAMLMILLKVCRFSKEHDEDSLVDIAGYTGLVEALSNEGYGHGYKFLQNN